MIKPLKKMLVGALTAIMLMAMTISTVMADEVSTTTSIPVTLTVNGENPPETKYSFKIEPITEGAPMPKSAEVSGTIKGAGVIEFEELKYSKPDFYKYKVTQSTGKIENITLDTTAYYVTVKVVWKDDTRKELETALIVSKTLENTAKCEMEFVNGYNPPKPTPPSGGGGGGGNSSRKPSGDALIGDDNVPLAVLGAFEEDPIPLAVLPMTGDVTNMALWMLMFTFCTLGMAITLLLRRKVA